MPKATLSFNLPDERVEYEVAVNAGKYYSALWELSQALRAKVKHSEEEPKSWQEFSDMFWSIVNDEGVELDK